MLAVDREIVALAQRDHQIVYRTSERHTLTLDQLFDVARAYCRKIRSQGARHHEGAPVSSAEGRAGPELRPPPQSLSRRVLGDHGDDRARDERVDAGHA
jgi:hypothetical protein